MFLNLTAILQGNSEKSVRDSLCYSMLNSSSSPQETRARGRYNTTERSDMSNARWILRWIFRISPKCWYSLQYKKLYWNSWWSWHVSLIFIQWKEISYSEWYSHFGGSPVIQDDLKANQYSDAGNFLWWASSIFWDHIISTRVFFVSCEVLPTPKNIKVTHN